MAKNNGEFLSGIFGAPGLARPRVSSFVGHPKDKALPKGVWNGWAWAGEPCDDNAKNWYFSLATHVPVSGTYYTRRNSCFASIFGILLDDVGTAKGTTLEHLRALLPPSIAIETSPGSYHAIYLFEKPVAERWRAEALVSAAAAAGMCDKRAKAVGTR
jgi:hypothetical protein